MRVCAWGFVVCFAVVAYLSWRYFFMVPVVFSIAIFLCLAAAAWLSGGHVERPPNAQSHSLSSRLLVAAMVKIVTRQATSGWPGKRGGEIMNDQGTTPFSPRIRELLNELATAIESEGGGYWFDGFYNVVVRGETAGDDDNPFEPVKSTGKEIYI
jgi:hypothetical protein